MKIEINIKKTHFILILTFLFLATFVIAYGGNQPAIVGHSIGELQDVAPNCLTNPGHTFCQAASAQSWELQDVAVASGYSAYSVNSGNSNALGSLASSSYCKSSGADCQVTLATEVRGSVVGGGNNNIPGLISCFAWGTAVCNSGAIVCPSGSTNRNTGVLIDSSGLTANVYICVKN